VLQGGTAVYYTYSKMFDFGFQVVKAYCNKYHDSSYVSVNAALMKWTQSLENKWQFNIYTVCIGNVKAKYCVITFDLYHVAGHF
jgi:hypothetical protein